MSITLKTPSQSASGQALNALASREDREQLRDQRGVEAALQNPNRAAEVTESALRAEPQRQQLDTPLELISVELRSQLNREGGQGLHRLSERLIAISLRALSGEGLRPQVSRVSATGVATELDLRGGDTFTINGVDVPNSRPTLDALSHEAPQGSAIAKAAAINEVAPQTGVRAVALSTRTDQQGGLNRELGAEVYGSSGPVEAVTLDGSGRLVVNGVAISGVSVGSRDSTGSLRAALNAEASRTGVTASLSPEGALVLEALDGRNISVAYEGARAAEVLARVGLRASGAHPYGGRVALVSYGEVTLHLGRDVNYSLGDVAGDMALTSGAHYSR
jgi:flagellin